MANSNTIQITLTVKDDGSVVVQQFGKNAEESIKGHKSALETLKGSYLDFAAKATTAYLAVQKAMVYMDQGAQAQQIASSFKIMAESSGINAAVMAANMKKMTEETIDDSGLMQKAVKMMTLGFDPAQIERFSNVVITASQIAGTTATEAYDRLADAISTRMPRALISMGAVTKDQMKIVTEAINAGADSTVVYELAMANLELKQQMLKGTQDEATLSMQRFHAQSKETGETIGTILMIGLQKLYGVFQDIGVVSLLASAGIYKVLEARNDFAAWAHFGDAKKEFEDAAASYKAMAEADVDAANKLYEKASQNIAGITNVEKKATEQQIADDKAKVDAKMKELAAWTEANEVQKKGIENVTALLKIAGADEAVITRTTIKIQEADLNKYYENHKQKIIQETADQAKAGIDRAVIEKNAADKIKELDDEILKKHKDIETQKTLATFQTAQNDIKNLTSRLTDYQKYYDSLKAMMDKNTADEKKHQDELKAIQQQRVDNQKTMNDLIAKMSGAGAGMTAQQQYESGRSALNQQFMTITNTMTGQDQIKALGDYIQAVAALQAQFAKGIPGVKDIFGGIPGDVLSAAKVITDATSDIDRATQMRENTLALLAEAQKQQITADQTWGQVLQGEAIKTQTDMDKLKGTIFDLSTQIANMQKTIELTGVDKVTPVIEGIIAQIEQLHRIADQPITINTTMGSGSSGASRISSNTGAGGATNDGDLWMQEIDYIPGDIGGAGYAEGTPYVPKTGIYKLHQGEAVIPAAENKGGNAGVTFNGDINIVIPAGAAPQSASDWRMITRNYIVPELRKLSS